MSLKRILLDEKGQIIRHILTVGIVVGLIVLVLVEVGPIVWLRISSIQDAEDVAEAAAFQYRMYRNEDSARGEVAAKMKAMGFSDSEIMESSVVFLPPGNVQKAAVRVTVIRYANTLVTRKIGALKKFARVSTSKEASVTTEARPR